MSTKPNVLAMTHPIVQGRPMQDATKQDSPPEQLDTSDSSDDCRSTMSAVIQHRSLSPQLTRISRLEHLALGIRILVVNRLVLACRLILDMYSVLLVVIHCAHGGWRCGCDVCVMMMTNMIDGNTSIALPRAWLYMLLFESSK